MASMGAAMHDGGMTVFDRHPRMRWLVPGATVAVIAAAALVGTTSVSADAGLEPLTPTELLIAVQEAPTPSLSGTVEITTDLGLPALPRGMGPAGTGPMALVSGTNTVRVWSDGPERARLAILGDAEEYDVIRKGDEMWTWSSADSTATRHVLPESTATPPADLALPSTPQEAADLALSALDSTTDVTVAGVASVAGRPVYELILTPRDDTTRVARVSLAIDAETKTPLRVQVFSTELSDPAIDVGFTSVDFTRPDASVFDFTPPSGATVVEHDGAMRGDKPSADAMADLQEPTRVGAGWSQIVVTDLPTGTGLDEAGTGTGDIDALLATLPTTSGPWGTGVVVDGTLMSAILTDDGRLAIGAVDPEELAAALAAG